MSLFHGLDDTISSYLCLGSKESLKHITTNRRLSSRSGKDVDFCGMVQELYSQIIANRSDHAPSTENWRVVRQTRISDANTSPEIMLERAIAILGEFGHLPTWYNQIPVASGLVDGRADKRAAIDLVKLENNSAELVELKWASDTPAYAASEILKYGLAYLYARTELGPEVYASSRLMSADRVGLRVLAPERFYASFNLGWLGNGISQGVSNLAKLLLQDSLLMDFSFTAFPNDFDMPFDSGIAVNSISDKHTNSIIRALSSIQPVWPNLAKLV